MTLDALEFRESLRSLGLQQTQLARLVRIHPSNVQRWAQGQARVPGAVEALLLVLLNTDLTYRDLIELVGA